jgi:hypothetical protein
VLVAFNSFGHPKLKLTGPGHATAGKPFRVTVLDGESGKAFGGAAVRGHKTGPKGHVSVTLPTAGTYRFKARANGAVRSNTLKVEASAG